jgi:flavin reductase (DIM6/NTAB) family NADH-FMN oxidoreductase RutF
VTIIGGLVDGAPVGFTCQSFYSVSIDPPLVSFCVMKSSTSWPKIRAVGKFLINVLSSNQTELSDKFSRSTGERWANVDWTTNEHNNPVISGVLLSLDCDLFAEHEAGDHWITIARVHRLVETVGADNSPLLYNRGRYRQLSVPDSCVAS